MRNGEETTKMQIILQFIDSARFMVSSLLNLANNLSSGIHRIKCKFGHNELNISIATVFWNIQTLKMI